MAGPSLSQPSEDIPQIFCKADGSQWSVFVEAGGIIGRPKLIRALKKAGAIVCSDPKAAQVILVDSSSPQGKLFIRDWGKDANKAVLEYSWANRSIAVGRILDRDEQWGGFLAVDDGLPIVKDEAEHNPLPTPRITPVEVSTFERKNSIPQSRMSIDVPSEISQPTPQPFQNGVAYSSDPNVPLPSQQLQPQLPPHVLATLMAQSQAMAQSFPQSQFTNMIPNFQFPAGSDNLPQAMMNVMNPSYYAFMHQGMMPWNATAGQNFGASFLNPQMNSMNPGQIPQDPVNVNTGYTPNSSSMPTHGSIESPQSPSGIPPSLRRKSPVLSRSTPSSYTSSGQMRSASPANYFASMSSYTSTQSTPGSVPPLLSTLFRSKTGRELSFFVQVDLNNRSKVVSAIKKNGGKIVTSNMTADYAILYSRSKTFEHLLESTLTAGRPAVSASFVYDSVEQNKILDPSPYEFDPPKPSMRGKRKRGKSEDDDDDEFPKDIAERKRLERNRRQTERRHALRLKEETSPVKKAKISFEETSRPCSEVQDSLLQRSQSVLDEPSRPRSPTPPAEHTRIRRGSSDGFMYSDHEVDYCRRYVKVLLERDHRISNSAIAQALSKKMDNHSLGSWKTFLTAKKFGTEYEELRKRASIAYRKVQSNREASQPQEKVEAGPSGTRNSPPRNLKPEPPSVPEVSKENLLEREVEIVAQFFATGGGQENAEEENADEENADEDIDKVWSRLTGQVQCQSAISWEEFYSEYHEAVGKRYNELTDIPTAEATSA
ncbi:hypothetical protein D9615_001472 [Tricholomella constricta]|uniref:BRCT domain-containing protein n=1 Tax=Tricholomella constricta TaxID=117010 RepID=A0A8H5HL01_9AGAR|nr:hypothetical protein D9615_001472 [Tricholomella constricta]